MNHFQNAAGNYCIGICQECGLPNGIDPSWLNLPSPKTLKCECSNCGETTEMKLLEVKPVNSNSDGEI